MSAKRLLLILVAALACAWPRAANAQAGAPLALAPGPTPPEAGRAIEVPGGSVYATGNLAVAYSLPSWTSTSGLRAVLNLHYNSASALSCDTQQGFGCGVTGPGGRLLINGDGTVTIREPDQESRNFALNGSNYSRVASEASRFDFNILIPTRVSGVITSFTEQAHDGRWRTFSDLDHDGTTFVETAAGNRTVDYLQYDYTSDEQRLSSISDASGRKATFTTTQVQDTLLITSITGAEGESIVLSYGANADSRYDLSSIQLPGYTPGGTAVTSLQTDGRHLLQSTTSPTSGITTYTYDDDGRVTSAMDRLGQPLVLAYYVDQFSVTDAYFNERTFKYLNGLLVKVISPDGLSTEYVYDASHLLIEVSNPLGDTTHYTYVNGDLTQLTDLSLNRTTTSSYNTTHDLLQTKDYLGNTTTFTRNSWGQPLTIADPTGVTTTITYDSSGATTRVSGDGKTQTRSNNAYGQPTSVTGFDGRVTTYAYDAYGNLQTVTLPCPDGTITRNSTPTGRVSSITDAGGVTTQYTYNDAHQVTSVSNSLGQSVVTTYGSDGNPVEVNDRGDDWIGQWDPTTGLLNTQYENGVSIQDWGASIQAQPLPSGAACSSDCATFCGTLTLCGQSVDCGTCAGGKVCSANNQCVSP